MLDKHERTCIAKIEKCAFCDYKPKNVQKFNEISKHIWNQHVRPCRFCGFKAENVEEWKQNFRAHEAYCEQRLQTIFQFLAYDVELNDELLRKVAFYVRKRDVQTCARDVFVFLRRVNFDACQGHEFRFSGSVRLAA